LAASSQSLKAFHVEMGDQDGEPRPMSQGKAGVLGSTGRSLVSSQVESGSLSARAVPRSGFALALGGEDNGDSNDLARTAAEAQFFQTQQELERVSDARHRFPHKQVSANSKNRAAKEEELLTGEEEETVHRRIAGFRLGFERIFATTSIKLPVSAYTIFVELRSSHRNESWSRCFNGLNTVFDIKKWIYEKLLLPMNAYELAYAESGKAQLTDDMRLLTTQESLDTRTLATTRAVHNMYKGMPGVHSIGDIGVTRLYVRLKCRTCGDILNSFQTCRKLKQFGHIEPQKDYLLAPPKPPADGPKKSVVSKISKGTSGRAKVSGPPRPAEEGVQIEDGWYVPDATKHCIFHTQGYELFQAARTHGGYADLARIFMSCNKEPSKLLNIGDMPLSARAAPAKISY